MLIVKSNGGILTNGDNNFAEYNQMGSSVAGTGGSTPAFAVKKLTLNSITNGTTTSIAHGLTSDRIKAVYGTHQIANTTGASKRPLFGSTKYGGGSGVHIDDITNTNIDIKNSSGFTQYNITVYIMYEAS